MTENNTSPDPQPESPQSPSHPEKHSSFSKGLENIILFGAGIAFITSLFSKGNKNEEESTQNDGQQEIENQHDTSQRIRKQNLISEDQKCIKPTNWKIPLGLVDSSMRFQFSWENFIFIFKLFLILGIFVISLAYTTSQNLLGNKILDFINFLDEHKPLAISILLASISGILLFFTKKDTRPRLPEA